MLKAIPRFLSAEALANLMQSSEGDPTAPGRTETDWYSTPYWLPQNGNCNLSW